MEFHFFRNYRRVSGETRGYLLTEKNTLARLGSLRSFQNFLKELLVFVFLFSICCLCAFLPV
jgi:hypothetical protein